MKTFNFGTNTTNRMESFIHKLKGIVSSRTSLKDMTAKLLGLIEILCDERTHWQVMNVVKVPTTQFDSEDEKMYYAHLITEAFKLVKHELDKVANVTMVNDMLVECHNRHFQCDTSTCTCSFCMTRRLSCRHIMAQWTKSGQTAFAPEVVHRRWTKEYSSQTSTEQSTRKFTATMSQPINKSDTVW